MKRRFIKEHLSIIVIQVFTLLIVAIMLLVSSAAAKPSLSQTSQAMSDGLLSYQGTLLDSLNNPVSGTYDMVFSLYASPSSSTALWIESRTGGNAVPINNGLFDLTLGSLVPIPASVWEEPQLYLGVKIGDDEELLPREKLTVVPRAAVAEVAQLALSVPDASIGSRHFAPTVYDSFITTTLENSTAEWMHTGNSITFNCDVDCTVHIIHRGLTIHSDQDRVDVNIEIDGVTGFLELSDSDFFFQNVSGQGIFDLSAGSHTVDVLFACNQYAPGTCRYYGSTGGVWEHLYVMVYAQD